MSEILFSQKLNHLQGNHKSASVLSPQTWPFSLQWLPPSTYLVGGNVRDALLKRHTDYLDLDFVLPEGAVETARAIAHHYKAGFVLLDVERQIARVVFDQATADFAQQVGPSLETDLQRRDFTVNAIAYSPHSGQLLDPLQGYADLQQQLIRMVAPENLKEDPLRLLRAYRQAAQLDFTLEPATQSVIHHLAGLLGEIAAERVQAELNYLLSTPKGTSLLLLAWQDGLLKDWLPNTTYESLMQLQAVDQAVVVLEENWSTLKDFLSGWMRDQHKTSGTVRSWLKVTKLTKLLSAAPQAAEVTLWRLKYSRAEIQAVLTALKFLPQVESAALANLSLREQYLLFQGTGTVFPVLAVLALASGVSVEAIAPLINRFLDPTDPVAHPHPLITGRDLIKALHLSAGPQIGQLLEAVQLARAEGKVVTSAQALEFAARQLEARD